MMNYKELASRCVSPNFDSNGNPTSWTVTCGENQIQLPESDIVAREAAILQFINSSSYLPINLISIPVSFDGHVAVIKVMSDALMIGEPDSFIRINMSMSGERKVAQVLGMSLMTPKVADLAYKAADIKIEPCTQTPDAKMAYTSRMIKHSNDINTRVVGKTHNMDPSLIGSCQVGCIADVGKDWVLSNRITNVNVATNYGWRTAVKPNPAHLGNGPFSGPDGFMWQTLGAAHNTQHVDYSQVVRLMSREIIVDGQLMDFKDVVTDKNLCRLINYDGVLSVIE